VTPVVIVLVIASVVALGMLLSRRRTRQDDGMHTFRRHIDALSPEARREVADRARRNEERRGPVGVPGPTVPRAADPTPSAPAAPAIPETGPDTGRGRVEGADDHGA
jgi:hypothetical protein